MEDGLLSALTYRHAARLHATFSLLTLALPTHWEEDKTLMETLIGTFFFHAYYWLWSLVLWWFHYPGKLLDC